MGEECTFCRIVAGEKDEHVVYDGHDVVAFLDRNPAVEGHTLIVPRPHRTHLLTDDDPIAVFGAIRTVASALDRVLDPDGFSTFYTTGPLVGDVEHGHVHLLPRYEGDDVDLMLSRERLDDEDAERLAERVRSEW